MARKKGLKTYSEEELVLELSRMPNAGPYLASQMGTVNDDSVEYVSAALRAMKDPESLPYIAAQLDSTRELVVIQAVTTMITTAPAMIASRPPRPSSDGGRSRR